MNLFYVYITFLILCCSYAIYRGNRSEYIGAAIIIIGSLATIFIARVIGTTWTEMEIGVFFVDLIVLYAMIHLVVVSDRFWPIWAAGFQLVAVIVHTAILFAPEITPWAFATGAAFWAYPMLLVLAIGAHEYVGSSDQDEITSS